MTLQATGLPTGTTPRATVDGQQVTLPRVGVEVPFASRHAYSFPGVVVDANNHLRITTAAAFNGEVRDNVSVTATYSTMGKLISDLVTAGKIKSVTGRQLANAWVPAEQGVVSDFQPLAGVRDFAEQVKLDADRRGRSDTARPRAGRLHLRRWGGQPLTPAHLRNPTR